MRADEWMRCQCAGRGETRGGVEMGGGHLPRFPLYPSPRLSVFLSPTRGGVFNQFVSATLLVLPVLNTFYCPFLFQNSDHPEIPSRNSFT
mmetsp:Transcript_33083/g.85168  ORF Transcript_33083/g.85168 Transcript_33083/m.85168 type:complete len:90 (-) Transcript_33083:73-342(-)